MRVQHEWAGSQHAGRRTGNDDRSRTMKAMRLLCCGEPLGLVELAHPEPAPDEVRVKIAACGVCHSDLHIADGEMKCAVPRTLGHEIAGTVEAIGANVTVLRIGDRVGVPWVSWTCGTCEWCTSGCEQLCPQQKITGFTVDGGYAESVVVAASHAARLPDAVSFAQAAPLMCAGLTVYKALKSAQLAAGQRLAVYGVGGLGHLAIQLGRHFGAEVAAVDIADDKLALARDLGAAHTINAAVEAADKALRKLGGVHVALVTPASVAAYESAFRSLRPRGVVVGVGMPAAAVPVNLVAMATKEARLITSTVGTRADLAELLALAAQGKVVCRVEPRALTEANAALDDLRAGRVLGRIVLVPPQ